MKYMGSKARFSREILDIVLADRKPGQYYIEPFAGGLNMIQNVSAAPKIANDSHPYLIAMWRALLNGWTPGKFTKEQYCEIRDSIKNNENRFDPHIVGWVGFNCSYSGKWFGGFAGETKTKIGTIRDYQQEAINNIEKQVKKLQSVVLSNLPYQDLQIPDNSIIYCDPPYQGTTEYRDSFDHKAFWEWAWSKHVEGHRIYVSEYSAPANWQCIWEKKASSSLSANGKIGGNKESTERLFIPNVAK